MEDLLDVRFHVMTSQETEIQHEGALELQEPQTYHGAKHELLQVRCISKIQQQEHDVFFYLHAHQFVDCVRATLLLLRAKGLICNS